MLNLVCAPGGKQVVPDNLLRFEGFGLPERYSHYFIFVVETALASITRTYEAYVQGVEQNVGWLDS
jgi:hypothetical protein